MKCPRCGSPEPHLHPAVQFEGEVEICVDDFHLLPKYGVLPNPYIQQVLDKRAMTRHETGETK